MHFVGAAGTESLRPEASKHASSGSDLQTLQHARALQHVYCHAVGSWGPAFFLNSNFKYLESSSGIFHAAASVVSRNGFAVFPGNMKHVEVSDGRFQHGSPFLETPRSFRRKIPALYPFLET